MVKELIHGRMETSIPAVQNDREYEPGTMVYLSGETYAGSWRDGAILGEGVILKIFKTY